MSSGCGCKEVQYIDFLILLIPYSSCISSFLQQHPTFLLIFLCFFSFFIP